MKYFMSTIKLNLYSTLHCHLCEQAEELLLKTPKISFSIIEIAHNEQLLLAYDVRIPVLKRLDTKAELNWPFSVDDIAAFLAD